MKSSIWTLILGILMIAAGIFALMNPFPASLAVVVFAAWSFMILGVLQVISAFRDASGMSRLGLILLGIIMIWLGFVLRGNPIEGLITLTIVVALSFIASGIAKLFVGWQVRGVGLGGWIMLSGIISVILGVMFMNNILGAAPWVLGFMLGIELISDGVAALVIWHSGRRA